MNKKGTFTFGERIAQGLRDAIAYESGEDVMMRVYEVEVPDPPPNYTAQAVRRIREKVLHLSQAAFAMLLNVSPKTVQGWEQGVRQPAQSAARLLQFIEHPQLLTDRLAAGLRKKDARKSPRSASVTVSAKAASQRAASPKSVTVPATKAPTNRGKQSAPGARRVTGSASSPRDRVKGRKR